MDATVAHTADGAGMCCVSEIEVRWSAYDDEKANVKVNCGCARDEFDKHI